ncbi:alpha/beta hydrolase [Pusillimonas sp. SM2304]|uniref:alpha/beta fold hydrolase n=1 Tax=Pusillimonas sp. SM2304 TaxID=3073241 RepID=UPI002876C41C|nr:alpha/beta hydrolase [Pusillimonas sp. SM2304]MDS1141858.1 alpha/beta hydrolase [Pusillimonas sp. SM2304]
MPYLDLSEDYQPYYEIFDYTDPWEKSETILFIHGFTEDLTAWRAWIPHLSRKYRLLMFDIRGFGKTRPVDETFKYSTDLFVDDIVRLVNRLIDEPVHVVSGKSGGISAMRFAATRPDLVKSLILTCPPLVAPGSSDWLPYMLEHGIRSWARKTMPARLGYDASPKCIDWWVDMMGATSLSTAKAYLNWVVTTEPRLDLDKIKSPALVIMTEPSEQTNAAAGQLLPDVVRAGMPQAEVLVLPIDCYHAGGAHPDTCAQAALKFLEKLS